MENSFYYGKYSLLLILCILIFFPQLLTAQTEMDVKPDHQSLSELNTIIDISPYNTNGQQEQLYTAGRPFLLNFISGFLFIGPFLAPGHLLISLQSKKLDDFDHCKSWLRGIGIFSLCTLGAGLVMLPFSIAEAGDWYMIGFFMGCYGGAIIGYIWQCIDIIILVKKKNLQLQEKRNNAAIMQSVSSYFKISESVREKEIVKNYYFGFKFSIY